jgi:uncharacterized protein YceK
MKARIAAVCVIVALALSLTGCGTVDNLCLPNPESGKIPLHVYGGVEADMDFLTEEHPRSETVKAVFTPLTILDLPLSFVGDTVTLPVTLGASMWPTKGQQQPQPR